MDAKNTQSDHSAGKQQKPLTDQSTEVGQYVRTSTETQACRKTQNTFGDVNACSDINSAMMTVSSGLEQQFVHPRAASCIVCESVQFTPCCAVPPSAHHVSHDGRLDLRPCLDAVGPVPAAVPGMCHSVGEPDHCLPACQHPIT